MRMIRLKHLAGVMVAVAGFMLATTAFAVAPGSENHRKRSSGPISTNSVVDSTGGVHLGTVTLVCNSAPCEVVVYDSASVNSGATVVHEGKVATTNETYTENVDLITDKGLYVEVTGTGYAFVTFE